MARIEARFVLPNSSSVMQFNSSISDWRWNGLPAEALAKDSGRNGGSPAAWQAVHTSPGLEDFWQLHYAEAGGKDPDRHDPRVTHEVGDLLFAAVNVARLLHVDPELALREAARRFERRVTAAAALATDEGHDWSALDLPRQEQYYQRAKAGGTP